jgi:hypothetical protein
VPGAVGDLRVVWSTFTRITIAWDAASGTVHGYRLARNGVVVGTTPRRRWRFRDLDCGTTYMLTVTPFNSSGAGPSTSINAATWRCWDRKRNTGDDDEGAAEETLGR